MEQVTMSKADAAGIFEAMKLQQTVIDDLTKKAAVSGLLSKEQVHKVANALVHAGKLTAYDMDKFASALEKDPGQMVALFEKLASEVAAVPQVGGPSGLSKKASAQTRTADDVWNEGMASL